VLHPPAHEPDALGLEGEHPERAESTVDQAVESVEGLPSDPPPGMR
jgi:hypothetical protein